MAVTDEMVCFSLYAASRATTQAYRELLEPHGLTYAQYLVLVVLWTEGERSVRELGEALQLDSGTLSPMLRRMEAAGLVERRRAQRDERVVTVTATARGAALQEELAHVPACVFAGTGIGSAQEARALIDTLHELTRTLRTVPRPRDAGSAAALAAGTA